MKLFKELTAAEEADYRKWAQENYNPFEPINGVWHPVVQDECVRINKEAELDLFEISLDRSA